MWHYLGRTSQWVLTLAETGTHRMCGERSRKAGHQPREPVILPSAGFPDA